MTTSQEQALYATLDRLGITHRTLEHAAVFTVEQAQAETGHLPGGHCKNLFLKDKADALWLLSCLDSTPVRLGRLEKVIGSKRLSFARPELLREVLGVEPGSVTPFALVNDTGRRVRPILDRAMLAVDPLNFHPLRNTATTTIATADLLRFMTALGYAPVEVDLATIAADA
jgi:Ala-tRNA(Pro) deacylase